MGRRRRPYGRGYHRPFKVVMPKYGPHQWHREATTVALSNLTASNATVTLFDPSSAAFGALLTDSRRAVLIKRVIVRMLAAGVTTAVNQLLHLVVSLLMHRGQGNAAPQYISTIASSTDNLTDLLAKEARSIPTSAVNTSFDAGNEPFVIDWSGHRELAGGDKLDLAFNGYISPGFIQPLPATTTIGVDFELSVLFSKSTGL